MLWICTAALRLGHCTREWPWACSHLYGAIAGGSHVCVHTHSPININSQAWRALAAEGALRVDATAIHANARCETLVYVWCGEGTQSLRHVSASVYELRQMCVQMVHFNTWFKWILPRGWFKTVNMQIIKSFPLNNCNVWFRKHQHVEL